MYVREKKIRRGDTTYSYWQVVQGARVDGKVRQTVVAHLGAWPDRETARVVAKMRGLICSEWGCGRAAPVEKNSVTTDFAKREGQLLLCQEHAEQLDSGETLTAVALGPVPIA
jgi:hypothetical protein